MAYLSNAYWRSHHDQIDNCAVTVRMVPMDLSSNFPVHTVYLLVID